MPTPYLHHDLWQPNEDVEVLEHDVEVLEHSVSDLGEILIFDNFYRNPEQIEELLSSSWVQSWKKGPNPQNFKEYYDCRLSFAPHINHHSQEGESQRLIGGLTASRLGYNLQKMAETYEFNLFQWINVPEQRFQSYPHQDCREGVMAPVIFWNKDEDCNSGTTFYAEDQKKEVGYLESEDLGVDVEEHFKLIEVVPAKFNRCIVYPGWFTHGAYIENHQFYSGKLWRMNQVYFMKISRV